MVNTNQLCREEPQTKEINQTKISTKNTTGIGKGGYMSEIYGNNFTLRYFPFKHCKHLSIMANALSTEANHLGLLY